MQNPLEAIVAIGFAIWLFYWLATAHTVLLLIGVAVVVGIIVLRTFLESDESRTAKLIEKRRNLAENRNLHEKMMTIGDVQEYYGWSYHQNDLELQFEHIYSKDDSDDYIKLEYRLVTTANYKAQRVFSSVGYGFQHEGCTSRVYVEAYTPGEWEQQLDTLYREALNARRVEQNNRNEKRKEKFISDGKRDFGL